MWLFIALVVVPIIEIALFIEVGGWIGLWPTIAIVILTALLGAVLLRHQGLAALGEVQERLRRREDPREPVVHGILILVAGVVLLTPGFFTDAIGFALLVPPVRSALIRHLGRRIVIASVAAAERRRSAPGPEAGPGSGTGAQPRPGPAAGQTIETEYEDVTDDVTGDGDRPAAARRSGWTRPE